MHITANGILMNYELSGKAGAPVVVLSHSLGSSMVMWHPQTGLFRKYFQLLCYDTRGHGGSETPPGPYTLELLATDAVCLLDELGIDRVHWVGISMGGMIGQAVALHHDDRLHRLVLCDTAAAIPEDSQPIWQERMDTVRKEGMQALVRQTLERWFTPSYLSKNPPAVEIIRRHFLETPVDGYIGCGEAIRKLNYLNELSRIDKPALIVVGADDPATPVAASQDMHDAIPNSKLVILPNAAHLSNIEQSEAFNQVVLDFLLAN